MPSSLGKDYHYEPLSSNDGTYDEKVLTGGRGLIHGLRYLCSSFSVLRVVRMLFERYSPRRGSYLSNFLVDCRWSPYVWALIF